MAVDVVERALELGQPLRERRVHVTQDDFEMAVAKVMQKDSEKNMSLRKLWK